MTPVGKAEYIYTYCKLPILLGLIALYLAGSAAYRQLSKKAEQLDIVLMNQEAYDIFSRKGYLLDLCGLLASDGALYRCLEPCLTVNTVILEDNSIEYTLNQAEQYRAVTEEAANGLDLSQFPLFQGAFPEPVYLGVVGNSPRLPAVVQYIAYLAT